MLKNSTRNNKKYNNLEGRAFYEYIDKFYEESVKFKKNQFLVPTGQSGKDYVTLLTKWITNYNSDGTFHGIAMKVAMTLPNLLLQKDQQGEDFGFTLDELGLWAEIVQSL